MSCFETFLFPSSTALIEDAGSRYYEHRARVMLNWQEGLLIDKFAEESIREASADIQKLRQLHVEMDNTVAAAYGWTDLNLDHGFHETKQGMRYTISETARKEVLQRLLKLNHERYAEEEKQGLRSKKGAAKKAAPKKNAVSKPVKEESTLFDMEDDE